MVKYVMEGKGGVKGGSLFTGGSGLIWTFLDRDCAGKQRNSFLLALRNLNIKETVRISRPDDVK
jgi:hypothetical protein